MPRFISRLPENILLRQISELEREINALKEVQEIGRNNTQVKTTKTADATDLSFTVPASGKKVVTFTFTPNRQRNAFLDFLIQHSINGGGFVSVSPYAYAVNDSNNSSNESIRTVKLLYYADSSYTVDIKFYVNSIDSGVLSWVVV